MRMAARRGAFSLVELLVVIGVIAILLSLILPAVQRVRDAAARISCASNLRQIALAAHQYHDVQQSFPAGIRVQNGRDPDLLLSWQAQLLPYLEQSNLAATIP